MDFTAGHRWTKENEGVVFVCGTRDLGAVMLRPDT